MTTPQLDRFRATPLTRNRLSTPELIATYFTGYSSDIAETYVEEGGFRINGKIVKDYEAVWDQDSLVGQTLSVGVYDACLLSSPTVETVKVGDFSSANKEPRHVHVDLAHGDMVSSPHPSTAGIDELATKPQLALLQGSIDELTEGLEILQRRVIHLTQRMNEYERN